MEEQDNTNKTQLLQMRRQREQAESRKRKLELDEEAQRKLLPGEKGFRYHARIPRAANMDYVVHPQSKMQPEG